MNTSIFLTRLAALLVALTAALCAAAQVRGVVANAETGVPLRGVAVYTNTGRSYTSDWRGQFAIDTTFTSATLVKADFVSLTVEARELLDTLYLLPRFNSLAEVTVWGKRRRFSPDAVRSWQPSFVPPATGGIGGLDILGLFRRKRPMSKEEVQKHKQIMEEY